jgi:hypothetical protein
MLKRPRAILLAALVAAAVVFCVVQDRVTAAGAQQYVTLQRAALAGQGQPVTVDGVMRPAVERSVRQAAMWSALVMAGGVAAAVGIARS